MKKVIQWAREIRWNSFLKKELSGEKLNNLSFKELMELRVSLGGLYDGVVYPQTKTEKACQICNSFKPCTIIPKEEALDPSLQEYIYICSNCLRESLEQYDPQFTGPCTDLGSFGIGPCEFLNQKIKFNI